ncbi:uncharacterized protein IL334_002900 [Kwoniella shivajii]|uniref:RRM domain-containing protein n=1 Tax=Kwoniella shivajii TaxID=564305 RepID=A0ABZ1CW09_9TREE|nr:hypothetical protein IL334_002900 [Kwoniella shivajii]
MSDRGRSRTPKSLTPSPRRARSYSRSPSRSRSRSGSISPRRTNGDKNGSSAKQGQSRSDGGLRVIVVSGLSKNVMKGHLEEIFGEYGRITGIDLPTFKVSGLNRGKAAIEFETPSDAQLAMKNMDGGQLDGSFLSVQISEHPLPAPKPISPPAVRRRRSISRSRTRSPPRRRRSPSYSRSRSPPRRASFRRRSLSRSRSPPPPRGFRGGRDSYVPRGGGGGGYGGGRGGYGAGGRGGGGGYSGYGGPGGPGGQRRDRSPLIVRRPGERGAPRRPSPEYKKGGRSISRSRSRSYSRSRSFSSRSRSPPIRRRKYTPSKSRSRSRSMSIDSRSKSRSRSMRSVSPRK